MNGAETSVSPLLARAQSGNVTAGALQVLHKDSAISAGA